MTSRDEELAPGRTVDRFRIEAVIGRGAMATVYRASHVHLGTVHAIKVLDVAIASVHRRLLVEGRAQASLRHPNVVAVSDVVQLGHALGLVMEYVDGPTLRLLLDKRKLSLAQAYDLGCGILDGVRAAHDAGIVHRDLKPANILLDIGERRVIPKITDFGLAKVLHASLDVSETRSGASMGTPAYMAPEQVRDAKDVDHRADVFTLGAILYELLAGTRPFAGDDVFGVMAAITKGQFVPLRELRPDVPDAMADAIAGALVVERDLRIPDVDQLTTAWRAAAPAALSSSDGPTWTGDLLAGLRTAAPSARLRDLPTVVPTSAATSGGAGIRTDDGLPSHSFTSGDDDTSYRRALPWRAIGAIGVVAVVGAVFFLQPRRLDPVVPLPVATEVPSIAPAPAAAPAPAPVQTAAAAVVTTPEDPAPAKPSVADAPAHTAPPARRVVGDVAKPPPSSPPVTAPPSAPTVSTPAATPTVAVDVAPVAPAHKGPADGMARLHVGGGVDVWLRSHAGNFLAGRDDVPAGTYAVDAFFPGTDSPTRVMNLDLASGDERTLRCDGAQLRCRLD